MADYTKYTNKEMQAITLAQQITNDNIAIVGTGLPLIGASVAKRLFAPKCNLIVESGILAEVTGETSGGMPGYIDLESPMMRASPGARPPWRWAASPRW